MSVVALVIAPSLVSSSDVAQQGTVSLSFNQTGVYVCDQLGNPKRKDQALEVRFNLGQLTEGKVSQNSTGLRLALALTNRRATNKVT